MVRLIPEFGWNPVVLTSIGGDYPVIDRSLEAEVPDYCKVFRTKTVEPYDLYRRFLKKEKGEKIPVSVLSDTKTFKDKFAGWLRANIFIPDPRIGWIRPSVKEGLEVVRDENIDLIFSTAPPPSVHLIAKKIAKKCNLPWVADFRDPWTDALWINQTNRFFISEKVDKALEKSVLNKADYITSISEEFVEMFRRKVDKNYMVINNGFNEIIAEDKSESKFIILFFGHLWAWHDVDTLMHGVNVLPQSVKDSIEFHFIGKTHQELFDQAEKYPDLKLVTKDFMPYGELMEYSKSASMLFKPYIKCSYIKGSIGAKLFDYLAIRKPIIAIGEKGSVADRILTETGSGKLFVYGDYQGISNFVQDKFKQWKTQNNTLLESNEELMKYSTKYNMKKLAEIFNNVYSHKH
jgi:glycosyltransferase involved in cell wall biosynthesis